MRVALIGSTASGKSAVAMAVARRLGDVELVSIDSMQVYRGMDIGTAKPSPAERAEISAPPDRPRRTDARLHRGRVPGGVHIGRRSDRRAWTSCTARRRYRPLPPSGDRRLRTPRGVACGPSSTRFRGRHRKAVLPPERVGRRRRHEDRADEPPPPRSCARGHDRQRPPVQFIRARGRQLPAISGDADRSAMAARTYSRIGSPNVSTG